MSEESTSNDVAASERRVLLVSADCHAGPPVEHYRDYVSSGLAGEFDEFLRAREEWRRTQNTALGLGENEEQIHALFGEDMVDGYEDQDEVGAGGARGVSDSDRRLAELAHEGIVAEVIFADLQNSNEPPWGAAFPFPFTDAARRREGAMAYNRWLADFCALVPGRRAGLAMIHAHDVEQAVQDVRWAKSAGLSGIALPTGDFELPSYHDRRYDPLWAECVEQDMSVTVHPGGTPWEGYGFEAMWVTKVEFQWWGRRPLWQMIFGGVFERHPSLKVAFTEQGLDWIPAMLNRLDEQYNSPFERVIQEYLSKSPSEYWATNCYVGASFMSHAEATLRDKIGVSRIMWGSDYPHIEGTWPRSQEALRDALAGCTEAEIRAMTGETAAEVYGFDRVVLDPLAEQIGPRIEDLISPARPPAVQYSDVDYAMGRVAGREMGRRLLATASKGRS
jgi:predicted TIM-barrel fold metal-dependent hydrolase